MSINKRNILIYLGIIVLFIFMLILHWHWQYGVNAPIEDYEYKQEIVKMSHNPLYRVENLRNLVGKEELAEFIAKHDKTPIIYTPNKQNIQKGDFQANLHMHTLNSDGLMSVEQLLDFSQFYAQKLPDNKYMYVAITDHNTILGAKDVIRVLQQKSKQYDRVKVIAGMEIFSAYNNPKISDTPVEIHILLWGINPYNKYLNTRFYKSDLNDKYNRKSPDSDSIETIQTMQDYGLVGIAHPARYTSHLGDKKYGYITTMFKDYVQVLKNKKFGFVEGYYQSYKLKGSSAEYDKFLDFINNEASKNNIIRTGSTDTHHYSIFSK